MTQLVVTCHCEADNLTLGTWWLHGEGSQISLHEKSPLMLG